MFFWNKETKSQMLNVENFVQNPNFLNNQLTLLGYTSL